MGLIASWANPESESHGPRRRPLNYGRILVYLALFGIAADGWSQQAPAPSAQQVPEQPQPGSIHGVVAGRDGAVYEGARVALAAAGSPEAASGELQERTTTSDSNGRFNFDGVPSGDFKLTISAQGFATQTVSGFLHPGETYEAKAIVLPFAIAASEVQVTASRTEIAQEQLNIEEKQRVFGVIPNFYVTYVPNAPPLTTRQKFSLAWKSSTDPVNFLFSGAIAGVEQADHVFNGYGQGAQGYAKRYGADFAGNFIATMIGSAILPSILKQDPRYFYKGTGTTRSRIFYAIKNAVVCKGDNGNWQVNYSAILGSVAEGGISNLYHPPSNRNGVKLTFENAAFGTAGTAAQNLFQEFLIRKLTPKAPSYGTSNP